MLTNELTRLPTRAIRLKNVVCPYCGRLLDEKTRSEDHVIGRKFVPKGSLENQPNLILNACRVCNSRKGDLEDDISAITMQPDVTGRRFSDHPALRADAAHKAKTAMSRYSKRPVGDSQTTMQLTSQLGPGATITFNMVGQAQISDDRAFELALRHFQAYFYLITYDYSANRGWWWKGQYAPILVVSKLDWGNERARAFMESTASWDHRVLLISADEHFKLAIRKALDHDIWSLAVEWNENYRVLAACGEPEPLKEFVAGLPRLKAEIVSQSANSTLAVRTEKRLKVEDDTLFADPRGNTAPIVVPPITQEATT